MTLGMVMILAAMIAISCECLEDGPYLQCD